MSLAIKDGAIIVYEGYLGVGANCCCKASSSSSSSSSSSASSSSSSDSSSSTSSSGSSSSSCQRCVTIYRARLTVESGNGCGEEVYQVDVDIPAGYTFPLTINITGAVDDDLKINGTLIEDNERNPPPPFPRLDCNLPHYVGGGPAGYTTTISSSPLTLTLVDNYGGNKILDVIVCLDPDDEQNRTECPTVTDVSSVGEGWISSPLP